MVVGLDVVCNFAHMLRRRMKTRSFRRTLTIASAAFTRFGDFVFLQRENINRIKQLKNSKGYGGQMPKVYVCKNDLIYKIAMHYRQIISDRALIYQCDVAVRDSGSGFLAFTRYVSEFLGVVLNVWRVNGKQKTKHNEK